MLANSPISSTSAPTCSSKLRVPHASACKRAGFDFLLVRRVRIAAVPKSNARDMLILMTPDERTFFELVDDYARTRHRCFLAEMNPRTKELGYSVCLRPLDLSENSDPFACKYLTVPAEQVEFAGRREHLPAALVDRLDAELSKLKQQT